MKDTTVDTELNKTSVKPDDPPISFICGKEMIEKAGIIDPDNGIVVYLFKESEVKDHGTDWALNLPESHNITGACLHDSITYQEYITNMFREIDSHWDLKTLSNIKL